MVRHLVSLVVAVIVIVGCKKAVNKDEVINVQASDPKMNAAIQQAKASVNVFIAALQSPRAGQSGFSVKTPITDAKGTEHMWLAPVTYDGKRFQGTINNDAETVTSVKIGDHFSIDPSGISDWMFIQDGKLVGGYTIRVLRDGMSPKERTDFDKETPFKIE